MTNPDGLLRTVQVRLGHGKTLRLARAGRGTPIVFLHGYPENLQIWCRVAPLLVDRFETVAFDWPGMGFSDEWPGSATPERQAGRLLTILDDLGIVRPVLVGIDMGAQPALVFAAMHPDRVRRLIVMNALVFGDERTSWEIHLLRRFGFNRFALRALPGVILYRAEQTFLPWNTRIDPALRADFHRAFRSPAVRRFITKMCAGYQGTLDRLPSFYDRIESPTLILWAESDHHFPVDQAKRLHRTLPGSMLEIVPGGTHWMTLVRASSVAESIAAFAADDFGQDPGVEPLAG